MGDPFLKFHLVQPHKIFSIDKPNLLRTRDGKPWVYSDSKVSLGKVFSTDLSMVTTWSINPTCTRALRTGFSMEPSPNGGRINLDAYGGTASASIKRIGDRNGDVDGEDLSAYVVGGTFEDFSGMAGKLVREKYVGPKKVTSSFSENFYDIF